MSDVALSYEEALREGWRLTKSRVGLWLGFLGVLVALGVAEGLLARVMDAASVRVALGLLFKVAQWFLTFNALIVSLNLIDGREVVFADFFTGRPSFGWYVLGTLLYGLVCGVGLLLLIVPGVILGLMFMFYGYVIAETGRGPLEAMKDSARLTKGWKGQLFLFSLLLIALNIVGVLCLFVGVFVTMAVSYFAVAHVYRQATRRLAESPAAA